MKDNDRIDGETARSIREESSRIIKDVMDTCHIYHVSKFKPEYTSCESRGEYKRYSAKLRWDFLFKNDGLITNINNYSSELTRFFEYTSFGDFPSSIRQKINIVGDLLHSEMDTFVPLHATLQPLNSKQQEIDIDDLAVDYSNYQMVIHPGFTRGIASIFLNTPLKKVLLYINKEHKLTIKESKYVKKINSEKELTSLYIPESPSTDIIYDFKVHKTTSGRSVKFHSPTDTPVLKVNNIIDGTKPGDKPVQLHHTNIYKATTFKAFDNYARILFSNKVKLYTDNGNTHALGKKFRLNGQKLQNTYFNTEFKHRTNLFNTRNDYRKVTNMLPPSALFNSDEDMDPKYSEVYKRIWKVIDVQFKDSPEPFFIDNTENLGGSVIEEIDNINVRELVINNNYKGIIIYVSQDITPKLDRLFFELLFCVYHKTPIMQTKCRGLIIINCNHASWKKTDKLTETIIDDRFLSYD